MPHYTYLIVGGGMTAAAAARGIRQVDPSRPIGLIGSEPDPPYRRPPLSKALWKGEPLERIWSGMVVRGVDLHLGREARALDPRNKRVTDDRGTVYSFDKLLLATGGTPRRLPFGGDRVVYFRTLADYRRLRALAGPGRRLAVIGGGFVGAEMAAALRMNGNEVAMVLPGAAVGERVFPRELAESLNEHYRQNGVALFAGESVIDLGDRDGRLALRTRNVRSAGEREIPVDGVVAGLGITPNTELARAAGLAVDNGIVVDELLRAGHPDIFAAGDVAAFPDPTLGVRRRVEHEDNANAMGELAGRAMAGHAEPYRHLPFFYSDLFELGYEAVGELDARLETVADWREPYREGVVYYLREGRVRGVLLWNVWEQVEAARRLIAEAGPFRPADLERRLPAAA
jgi:NADPH-dependent 2,4-dienoyl-CoA reductase/sulfur reductase-like enzyme